MATSLRGKASGGFRGECFSETYHYISKTQFQRFPEDHVYGRGRELVFKGCQKKVKPIALSVIPDGCDGYPKPAGLDSMDKNTKSGRRGLAGGPLPGIHEKVLNTGSSGLPYPYWKVKAALAKIYDNEIDPVIHDKHIMGPWERCMVVMWIANFWIIGKKYKNDKAVGGLGIDTGVCQAIGCAMDVRGDEKSNGHILQNINNLFNPWDLVPAIKLDGGALAKCASDSFQKETEVTSKINFMPVAQAGSGGVHVGLVSSGSLFFKETCAGGGMPGSLWALERCFLWMQHLMLAALALACKGHS